MYTGAATLVSSRSCRRKKDGFELSFVNNLQDLQQGTVLSVL